MTNASVTFPNRGPVGMFQETNIEIYTNYAMTFLLRFVYFVVFYIILFVPESCPAEPRFGNVTSVLLRPSRTLHATFSAGMWFILPTARRCPNYSTCRSVELKHTVLCASSRMAEKIHIHVDSIFVGLPTLDITTTKLQPMVSVVVSSRAHTIFEWNRNSL